MFCEPLQADLTSEQLANVFGNFDALIDLAIKFCNQLSQRQVCLFYFELNKEIYSQKKITNHTSPNIKISRRERKKSEKAHFRLLAMSFAITLRR